MPLPPAPPLPPLTLDDIQVDDYIADEKDSIVDQGGLNFRERKFLLGILNGKTNAQAYRDAGFTQNINSSNVGASVLLSRPKIKAALRALQDQQLEALQMSAAQYIAWVQGVMTTPIADIDDDHQYCQKKKTKLIKRTVAGEVEIDEQEVTIEMVPKMEAAKQFALVMGLNKPAEVKVDLSVKVASLIKFIRKPKSNPNTIDV